mgnify:CR=1 FL=1
MKIREIIQTLFPTRTWKLAAIIAGGVLCGLGVLYLICFPGVDLFVGRPGYLRELPHYGPLLCYMES